MSSFQRDDNRPTDIFMLDTTIDGFFKWLRYRAERLPREAGQIMVSWDPDMRSDDPYHVVNVGRTRVENSEGVYYPLFSANLIPIANERTIVELNPEEGADTDIVYLEILRRINGMWPGSRRDIGNKQFRAESRPSYAIPIAPTPIHLRSLHDRDTDPSTEYRVLPSTNRTYRQPIRNTGGHPALKANEWAWEQLSKRPPREREAIFQEWKTKYIEEVGPEAAQLRDLRDTFNSAMNYRYRRPNRNKSA